MHSPQRDQHSNHESKWVGYRTSDFQFSSASLEHPFGFAFQGQEVFRFNLTIDFFDMGEVYLDEPDNDSEVNDEQYLKFRTGFKKQQKKSRLF